MESNCKHEEKICPRCQKPFECKIGDILNCQCYGVDVDDATGEFIRQNYDDCLCRDCLLFLPTAINQLLPEINK